MRWYFLTDNQEQVPTSEEQIAAYAGQGILRAHHLIWHEGQGDWKSLGEIKPELFSAGPLFRSDAAVANRVGRVNELASDGLTRYLGWIIALAILLELGALILMLESIAFLREIWKIKEVYDTAGLGWVNPLQGAPTWLVGFGVMSGVTALLLASSGIFLMQSAADLRRSEESGQAFLKERAVQRFGRSIVSLCFFASTMVGALLLLWKIGTISMGSPPKV